MIGRDLTPDYSVSPQITPDDVGAIKEAGFDTVICNRPDAEVPPDQSAAAIRAAVEAAGLRFVENQFSPMAFDLVLVDAQDAGRAPENGRVFAYCASGNRSSILWAMGQARAGEMDVDAIIATAAEAGYDLRGVAPQLAALKG